MFRKWLLKLLLSLSAEQKEQVRKALFEDVDGKPTEIEEEQPIKENETMDKEKETVETTETEKTEVKADETAKEPEKDATAETKKDETVEETAKETTEETAENPEETGEPVVEETPTTGNAVRVEDLVTVDQLKDALSALEAKLDAIVQENKTLKDKYEETDFGAPAKKGVDGSKGEPMESFDSYAKKFM